MEHLLYIVGVFWLGSDLLAIYISDSRLKDFLLEESDFLPYMKRWALFYLSAPPVLVKSVLQVILEWLREDVAPRLTSERTFLLTGVNDAIERR